MFILKFKRASFQSFVCKNLAYTGTALFAKETFWLLGGVTVTAILSRGGTLLLILHLQALTSFSGAAKYRKTRFIPI
jgi:hypothetical protein